MCENLRYKYGFEIKQQNNIPIDFGSLHYTHNPDKCDCDCKQYTVCVDIQMHVHLIIMCLHMLKCGGGACVRPEDLQIFG